MLETADQPSTNGPTPNRVQALLGIACALTVAAGLGFPGLDAGAGVQLLLVVVGFRLARVVHRCSSEADWRIPMVLGLAGRAVPTMLLMIVLVAVHRMATGGLDGGETLALIGAATFTSDVVPFLSDASFRAVDHLWAVALVAQAAVASPWLLTARRQRLGPRNRALLLFGVAGLLSLARIVMAAIAAPAPDTSWLTPPEPSLLGAVAVWTSLDALLIGMAIGTLPLATLHRHPTTRLAIPAVVGLAVVLVGPSVGSPAVDVGLRLALAATFGGIILSSEAISSLPRRLAATLTNPWWHRLGSRSLGLYLWHIPFAHAVTGGRPFDWPGPFTFVLIVALTLAAATTTYRSIEIPTQMAMARAASGRYRIDAVLLPSVEPQRGKWMRWEDLSLDRLPIPTRRRSRRSTPAPERPSGDDEPLGRRLWQLGDREIDLRVGRRARLSAAPSPDRPVAPSGPNVSDPDHLDQSAAAG